MRTRNLVCHALAILAAAVSIPVLSAAPADRSGVHPAMARFAELVPWFPDSLPAPAEVTAFEEHDRFVYLAGFLEETKESAPETAEQRTRLRMILLRPATLTVDLAPFDPEQRHLGEPILETVFESTSPDGDPIRRIVCVFRAPGEKGDAQMDAADDGLVAIRTGGLRYRLLFPAGPDAARIAIESDTGESVLAERRLPEGVLPFGEQGMRLLEIWDSRYRADTPPAWDTGQPSRHLKAAVESREIQPGRAVILGCGTGTNALYLAEKGFDVTAIDIAPTALNLAEETAKKSGLHVSWMLADVLAPPADLGSFDFLFDRGCYHGVRRGNAEAYVESAKRLSHPGTRLLILAGNANEERHYGPPRVKEEEIRGDFSADFDFLRLDTVRFDSQNPAVDGALAWSILLRRKE